MVEIRRQKTDGRSATHDGFEKMINQALPTVEEIIKETGMSRADARKEYKRNKEKHRWDPELPNPSVYANAYDSWSMD